MQGHSSSSFITGCRPVNPIRVPDTPRGDYCHLLGSPTNVVWSISTVWPHIHIDSCIQLRNPEAYLKTPLLSLNIKAYIVVEQNNGNAIDTVHISLLTW
jgi:hypothetical protein